jgi:hypothetical protein
MALVNPRAHSEHVQVIRCEKFRDVQNELISGKKAEGISP